MLPLQPLGDRRIRALIRVRFVVYVSAASAVQPGRQRVMGPVARGSTVALVCGEIESGFLIEAKLRFPSRRRSKTLGWDSLMVIPAIPSSVVSGPEGQRSWTEAPWARPR